MNGAHLHLIVNHLPVVGFLFATPALLWALWSKNRGALMLSLALITAAGVSGVAANFTGEGAEHVLEDATPADQVVKDAIHEHEEGADFAWVLGLLAALDASVCLVMINKGKEERLKIMLGSTVFFALMATTSMSRVAFLGGKIRHTETGAEGTAPKP